MIIPKGVTAKDIAINREALLNRLCSLHQGQKTYEEILEIAKEAVKENFEFCYAAYEESAGPRASTADGTRSPY